MTTTPEDSVHAMADQLRQYATHFAMRDWDYTRETQIRHIRYRGDWTGYDHPRRRVARLLGRFVKRDRLDKDLFGMRVPFGWRHPLIAARVALRTERHQPDGVLDEGAIITHWEETGEYLQYVQPSVGALLADWLDADPESDHAQAIAAEMKRINDRYGERVATDDAAAA